MEESEEAQLVHAHNLSFDYGGETVLDSVSFGLKYGQIIVFYGKNGSGKTTLLKLLYGLERVKKGKLRVLRYELHRRFMGDYRGNGLRREIFFVSAKPVYFPMLTVAEHVNFVKECGKMPRKRGEIKVREVLSRFFPEYSYRDFAKKRAGELSDGERKRFFLALSFLSSSKIFLYDEPYSFLDSLSRRTFDKEVKELAYAKDRGVIICTSDFSVFAGEIDGSERLKKYVIEDGTVKPYVKRLF
jgi:ABC-type multidrug transport system ATPase subunit